MDGVDGRPRSATVTSRSDSSQFDSSQFPVDYNEWIEVMMNINNNMSEHDKRAFGRFVGSHSQTHFNCVITNLTIIPRLEKCLKECLQDAWKYISTPKNKLILQPYLGLCAIYQIALRKIKSYDALTTPRYEEDLFKYISQALCAFIPYNTRDTREGILNIGLIRYYIEFGNLNQLNDNFFSFPLLSQKYSFKNFMQLIVDTAEKQEAEKQEAEKKSPQMPDDVDSNVEGGKLRRRRQYRRRRSIKKSKSKSRSRSRSRFRKVRKTRRYRK
jgi:hypothetical protein